MSFNTNHYPYSYESSGSQMKLGSPIPRSMSQSFQNLQTINNSTAQFQYQHQNQQVQPQFFHHHSHNVHTHSQSQSFSSSQSQQTQQQQQQQPHQFQKPQPVQLQYHQNQQPHLQMQQLPNHTNLQLQKLANPSQLQLPSLHNPTQFNYHQRSQSVQNLPSLTIPLNSPPPTLASNGYSKPHHEPQVVGYSIYEALNNDRNMISDKITKPKKGGCVCAYCDKKTKTFLELAIHNDYEHKNVFRYLCTYDDCPYKYFGFKDKQGLDKHIKNFHNSPLFWCTCCNRSFKRKDLLKRHYSGRKHEELYDSVILKKSSIGYILN
ncbi:C2H2-type zinc finger protein ASCRUDRAFT_78140 [Ascoidea rubescens DSM 1968]|uniref:C2H2-type domain-containing protein n=1 Tax=Ascoidea rubescens DSM 1968 TaxID=1344418 RepID=A0A1D2V9B3_9ASCO|nr:hypothetical protein ASCRUDRAFT_78140 [Ascoidea rubescens DSM 1968]ODV58240.1 hypothetical protein ASCRUDRAFT_78140 [Ascoidea rubescens DSM 1968]